jgi:SHS2 domain-containing protein
MPPYRFLDHTADLMIEVRADSLEELFSESAVALFDVIVGVKSVSVRRHVEVQASGDNKEELLVDWLRELFYLFSGERMVLSHFEILHFSETELHARCGGERYRSDLHEVRFDVKAVTYHGLSISHGDGGYSVSVLFDV